MTGPISAEAPLAVSRSDVMRGAVAVLVGLNVINGLNIALIDRGHWLLMAVERNPSTWFASAVLAVTGLLAWVVGRAAAEPGSWNFVAGVLLLMSVDEVATFHEMLGGLPGPPHIGSRAWIGAGLLIAAVVAVRLLPWVMSLPPSLRLAFLQSATLFLAGAIGIEWWAGTWHETHGDDRVFFLISTVEENLELMGVLLLADRLLRHAVTLQAVVRLQVIEPSRGSRSSTRLSPTQGRHRG